MSEGVLVHLFLQKSEEKRRGGGGGGESRNWKRNTQRKTSVLLLVCYSISPGNDVEQCVLELCHKIR